MIVVELLLNVSHFTRYSLVFNILALFVFAKKPKLITFDCVEIAVQLRVFQILHKEKFEGKI